MRLRIITDDFTSALDGTACFAQRRWDTALLLAAAGIGGAAVASVDTRSREDTAAAATGAVAAVAAAWRHADVLVKQFDSTLRGFVAEECLAARAASGRRKLLIAPAFPSEGRSTEGGSVYVHGVPVHLGAFARDPTRPVTQSSLPQLFGAHGQALQVARDAAHARVLLDSHDAVVVDARCEEDLERLVDGLIGVPDLLWAGSTGLLRAMARRLPPPARAAADPAPAPAAQRPLLVVGSLNPCSRRQLEAARGRCGVRVLATAAAPRPGALRELVRRSAQLLRAGACDALVVTGGETARQIVDALPALALRVRREVEAGTPLVTVETATSAFPMITKAGGFGDDRALLRCLDAITGEAS